MLTHFDMRSKSLSLLGIPELIKEDGDLDLHLPVLLSSLPSRLSSLLSSESGDLNLKPVVGDLRARFRGDIQLLSSLPMP